MRKLKLELDRLAVETFETSRASAEHRGTVLGAAVAPAPFSKPLECLDTQITGPCCDYTLALSCVQTNCLEDCTVVSLTV